MSFDEPRWRKLARYVANCCGLGLDDADEAEQEAVVKAWQVQETASTKRDPDGYTEAVVRNKVIDRARKVWRTSGREVFYDDVEGFRIEEVDKR